MKKILLIIGFCLFAFFALLLDKGIDPDLGWHLRIGEQILNGQKIPNSDTLTFTMPNHFWVDHEWALNSFLYFGYDRGSWLYIVLGFAALIILVFTGWLKKVSNWWQVAAICAAAAALSGFLFVRPAVISFFLFACLYGFLQAEFDWRILQKERFLAILAVFMWFWANLHAGFVAGLFLIGLYILWDLIYDLKKYHQIDLKTFKYDCLLMAICVLVPLINPYGWELYGEVLRIMTSTETHKYIAEWLPGIITANWISYFYWVPFVWLMYCYKKSLDLRDQFIAGVFLIMYLMSQRQFMTMVIVTMPVFINALTLAFKEWGNKWYAKLGVACYLIFILILFPVAYKDRDVNRYYPEKAVTVLREYAKKNDVVLFNDYNWGGLISWELPNIKHYIDGRMPHWKAGEWSLFGDYMQGYYFGKVSYQNEMVKHFGIDTVLLSKTINTPKSGQPMADNLKAQGWQTLYEDSLAILLTKNTDMQK